MKLGHFLFPPYIKSVEEAIDSAAELGFYSVELSRGMFAHFPTKEDAFARAREIKEYADARGIKLRCLSHCVNVLQNPEQKIEELKFLADICKITDCKFLHHTLVCGVDVNDRMPYEEAIEQLVPVCREVYDYAASLGVQCVYEPQGMVINGVEPLVRFVEALDRDAKMVADLGNSLFVNTPAMDIIKAFAGKIAHVHIKDYYSFNRLNEVKLPYAFGDSKEKAERFYRKYCYETPDGSYIADAPLGEGVNDFTALFAALLEQGYDGVFHLEEQFWSEDAHKQLDEYIAYCKRCYEEAKRRVGGK